MERKTATARRSVFRRIILGIVVALVVLAVAAYFLIGFIAAAAVTTPTREFSSELTPAKYQMAYEDIKVTARIDGIQIAGWFIPSSNNSRVIIMVHGRNQSRTGELYRRFLELASNLHQGGLNVMMIDLRGHGQSPDAHWSFGLRERRDIEGAVDWLTQRGFKQGNIGALGISLGAASVIGAGVEEPKISAIVTDSLFADLNPIIKAQWKSESGLPDFLLTPSLWMVRWRYGYDLTQSRPVAEISKVAPRPVLIIHSTDDALVPVENARKLQAAYPGAEAWIFSGPEHARSYNAFPAEYSQRVNAFFNKNLR